MWIDTQQFARCLMLTLAIAQLVVHLKGDVDRIRKGENALIEFGSSFAAFAVRFCLLYFANCLPTPFQS